MPIEQKKNGGNQESAAGTGQNRAPSISPPKGGGAIRGMGEKFAANPVTGTGSMSVPIACSPGRAGFGPQLSLSYDSGAGNGPFGFGWNLSLPAITRKTDKGLPQYLDEQASDVFILSGAEDLAPILTQNALDQWVPEVLPPCTVDSITYTVRRYRPRIEGLFARIERWTGANGDVHWRSISKDNILTIYGKDADSRIADPGDTGRIFSWLICETRDDKGNAVIYRYQAEDGKDVDLAQANERNRERTANRYLKRIFYGNRAPLLDDADYRPHVLTPEQLKKADWMFEVVFDYGEHDADVPTPKEAGVWLPRVDPFSTYRAGFEVRTYRLCRRVLMFHHFPNEAGVGQNCLVRSTKFDYRKTPIAAFITAITQSGYKRANGGYLQQSMPPLEFEYSQAVIGRDIQNVDAVSMENLPIGVDGAAYQWVDLDSEGLSGILTEQGGGWFYKRNESALTPNVTTQRNITREDYVARFAPVELVARIPGGNPLTGGHAQFLDLAGDGQVDRVELDRPVAGFYERTTDQDWEPFRPFTSLPNLAWNDPNLKFIDLTGDGHADVLITEDQALTWYPSLAEDGFGPATRVSVPTDEERGPRVVFADGAQTMFLADLSGDGLTDIARIRNGEVCYWPNLGYGRFGAKVTMDDAPWFDTPDQFDPRRIRLADIDGSGVTDILYLGRNQTRCWFNQSGNAWSAANDLPFPPMDNVTSVAAVDLLGNGAACLVWSSPLPGVRRTPMKYLKLMAEGKPHLLINVRNNLGAETQVQYAPSTRFYLDDKHDGKPWITRLPFPVHVVERVETFDAISGNRFVTRYAYHHGYFDGEEREFRGFGMVEQWDTEEFNTLDPKTANVAAEWYAPPVRTKTWFHTGAFFRSQEISRHLAQEYFGAPPDKTAFEAWAKDHLLDDTVFPDVELNADEQRQAVRALKGAMLRQEVYALDGTDKAAIPYTVTEQNFTIKRVQPQKDNRHAVFFTHPREAISYHYERNPADPRIQHALTLEVDPFGNVLKGVAIGYGRRNADAALPTDDDRAKQTRTLITYTENRLAVESVKGGAIDTANDYRTPLPAETRTYELTGLTLATGGQRLSFADVLEDVATATPLDYEKAPTLGQKQKRLIEHVRTLYRKDDLTALLPLYKVEPLALPGESYKLTFTPGLVAEIYSGRASDAMLKDEGRYVHSEGDDNGWIPAGRVFYSDDPKHTAAHELVEARSHCFLPRRYCDPFGQNTVLTYDDHDLLVIRTRDALDNTVTAANDYRVLQPRLVTDPNGNRTEVAFDALGLVVATAVMGKEGEKLGDSLKGFHTNPALANPPFATLQDFVADPQGRASSLLSTATTRIIYDLDRYQRVGQPPLAATLARETHFYPTEDHQTRIQISFSYSDGFGREIQKKIQAEEGDAPQRQADVRLPTGDIRPGDLVRDAQGTLVQANTPRRWVGSGRTVFNNKGKPVKQYEPFFSATHLYEPERDMTDTGVSPVLFYDPVERVVATLHPNDTYEKVVFDPWQQTIYDVNDTVLSDPRTDPNIAGYVREYFKTQLADWQTWHTQRIGKPTADPEHDAAQKAAAHAGTPTTAYFDTLGRTFLTIANNGKDAHGNEQKYCTRVELDIEGNQREVIDAKDRVVMRYAYDLLGNRIHQASMEAGERWMLNDVAGKPIRAWDSRGFIRRMTYDELRRPAGLYVTENDAERLAERTVYGEGQGDSKNHRTRVYQVYDGAGIVTHVAYDFKGNLRESQRQLLQDYKQAVDWTQNLTLEAALLESQTTYDALNRPLTVTSPDGSVYRPIFNKANLLDKVDVKLHGALKATPFVTNIDYDAKGQRTHIDYGNGASTFYDYDPRTFRLIHLRTVRAADNAKLQDLSYAYDPAGNITHIRDDAQRPVFFNGQVVRPDCDYSYDALYRLVSATGREHIGQHGKPPETTWNDEFRVNLQHPHDGQAMRNYTEQYVYDAVGNFEKLIHQATQGDWVRGYAYNQASLTEPANKSNRLSSTTVD
ncbi:MAG: SpvB/TcaC N-terminal domain-containing protein, partial [Candidatus Competibacter phosphatis]